MAPYVSYVMIVQICVFTHRQRLVRQGSIDKDDDRVRKQIKESQKRATKTNKTWVRILKLKKAEKIHVRRQPP